MLRIISIYYISFISMTESAKILGVFPTPSISHQIIFRPLMEELANRGHQIVVITADPAFLNGEGPPNLTEIDVHDISYRVISAFSDSNNGTVSDFKIQSKNIFDFLANLFDVQVQSEQVQNLILDKKNSFDLIFTEACIRPSISFSYVYKVPVIEISSFAGYFGTFESIGAATHPIIYPNVMRHKILKMSKWEKVIELYQYYSILKIFEDHLEYENKMLRRLFGHEIPGIQELRKNIHMLFVNVHPIWDFNRPVPPNVIYLGQMHLQKERVKDLPQDLSTFIESSHNGVIYMSFGTNVKTSLLPPEKIEIFTKFFSQMPYDVLWKWDGDKPPTHSKNVKFSKWFPQSMLLKHTKIKLFITQGGLQSTDEALTAGVPLIAVPMLGDQWFNAEQYVFHGIGKMLNLEDLNEDILKGAIQDVIGNTSYRKNVIRLGTIMRDRSTSSLEKAVWWTEYVLRHDGAEHLMSPAAHMSWIDYYEVNLVISLVGIILIFFVITMLLLLFLVLNCSSKKAKIKYQELRDNLSVNPFCKVKSIGMHLKNKTQPMLPPYRKRRSNTKC